MDSIGSGTALAPLRSRLAAVRKRRSAIRWVAAISILGFTGLAVVAAAFATDWLLSLSRAGRAGLLLAAGGTLAWVFSRHVRPWLRVHESDLDIAMEVELQQGIDSDLVAALQFEEPGSNAWGSGALRAAVVDYVAEFGQRWTIPSQVPHASLRRRLGWLAAALVGIAAAVAMRPDFAAAFVNRMLLGSAHYPTRTTIASLTIGGNAVDPTPGASVTVTSPLGQPLDFEVGLVGEQPASGRVRLSPIEAGAATTIQLTSDQARPAGTLVGNLPKLTVSVDMQIFAGDAWTDPIPVVIVPLPIVETLMAATPPAYARTDASELALAGARQVTVVEGSSVALTVSCVNKPLRSVSLVIDRTDYPLQKSIAATPAGNRKADSPLAPLHWQLSTDNSPLAHVTKPVRFEVRVVDEDGLSPATPVMGAIRLKADLRPRISAEILTRVVLPTGIPSLTWRVSDDHGIREVSLLLEPLPLVPDTSANTPAQAVSPTLIQVATMPPAGWLDHKSLPMDGSLAIPLASLGLEKGDQVRVTLQATDYRGNAPGQTASSEPIVLDITDENGIMAALSETDGRSATALNAIIERQLGVGESP